MNPCSSVTATAFRLMPGEDLRGSLNRMARESAWESAAIVTAVGSLSQVVLRFANQKEATCIEGKHEIVSLVGTLSQHGSHLHVSVADAAGKLTGGHLLDGSTIFTTAEIVIAQFDSLIFRREMCAASGYSELQIETRVNRS